MKPHESPGSIIKSARLARRWSQAQLGKAVGISQPAVRKIEAGRTAQSRYMIAILDTLGLDPKILGLTHNGTAHILPGRDPTTRENPDTVARHGAHVAVPAGAMTSSSEDLPVWGLEPGGLGLLCVRTRVPVEYVTRPAPLERVREGYGIVCGDRRMEPELALGDIVLVHPYLPVVDDKTCVFYSDQPDGRVHYKLARLVQEHADFWQVRQWNSGNPKSHHKPKPFRLAKKHWGRCHLVVGNYKHR